LKNNRPAALADDCRCIDVIRNNTGAGKRSAPAVSATVAPYV
jgi:hypothetical protein